MKKMTKVAAFIGLAVASSGATAADWNVIQNADITVAAPTINQGDANNVISSNQAVNGIVLDVANDDLATGTQTANIASTTGIVLTQGGTVDSSNQAINFIVAEDVGTGSTIVQTVNQTGAGSTTQLTQIDTTSTGGNFQAANLTKAEDDVIALNQTYIEVNRLDLRQSNVNTANNSQGVNYTSGDNLGVGGSLTQSVTVGDRARLIQGAGNSGGNNTQVANGAVATEDVDNTTQSFTVADRLVMRQAVSGANNVQAGNLIIAGDNDDIGAAAGLTTQTATISAGDTVVAQTASASNNVQALNLSISGGNILSLRQTVSASTSTAVDFDQTPTAASNTQAGNMAQLTAGGNGDVITDIDQTFTSSTTSTAFDQVSSSGTLIQAGNLIDVNNGSITDNVMTGTTQLFEANGGSVSMVQDGNGAAAGNIQALNAIVDSAGNNTSGGTVSQQLTIASTTFTMSQNNITGSGQYGNFVGVKY